MFITAGYELVLLTLIDYYYPLSQTLRKTNGEGRLWICARKWDGVFAVVYMDYFRGFMDCVFCFFVTNCVATLITLGASVGRKQCTFTVIISYMHDSIVCFTYTLIKEASYCHVTVVHVLIREDIHFRWIFILSRDACARQIFGTHSSCTSGFDHHMARYGGHYTVWSLEPEN